jgi:oxygen-dependent protoporphyrinogen oxidase
MRHSVAIVGGGISGLAAAHRLREISPEVDVLLIESADRLGGVINTVRHDGLLLEMGADSFLTKPDTAINLCRRVGLESEVISTRRDFRRAFVVSRGALRNIPEGFMLMAPSRIWPILTTPILSPLGKLRLALECIVPRSDAQCDESLAQFAIRRLAGRLTKS